MRSKSLRLVGANIIGTVLNRVKAGPAYQYYPSFAASRPALEGPTTSSTVRALNSGSASPAQPGKSPTQSAGGAFGKSQPAAPMSNSGNEASPSATTVLDTLSSDASAHPVRR